MQPVRSSATFQSLLKPFDKGVWATLLGWILAMSLIIYYGEKVRVKYELWDDHFTPNLLQTLFFILQSLCQQGESTGLGVVQKLRKAMDSPPP